MRFSGFVLWPVYQPFALSDQQCPRHGQTAFYHPLSMGSVPSAPGQRGSHSEGGGHCPALQVHPGGMWLQSGDEAEALQRGQAPIPSRSTPLPAPSPNRSGGRCDTFSRGLPGLENPFTATAPRLRMGLSNNWRVFSEKRGALPALPAPTPFSGQASVRLRRPQKPKPFSVRPRHVAPAVELRRNGAADHGSQGDTWDTTAFVPRRRPP